MLRRLTGTLPFTGCVRLSSILVSGLCLALLASYLTACDGKKESNEQEESDNAVSYIGPGTFGIHPDERTDSAKVDVWYHLNVDGTYIAPTIPNQNCPIVYSVGTRRWQAADSCDAQFDYTALIQAAEAQAREFASKIQCPQHCRFREGYPDPRGDHWIKWDCVKQVDGGYLYFVAYTGFFVCTNVQN